jgi:two-component system CheB/CheR fusion protein
MPGSLGDPATVAQPSSSRSAPVGRHPRDPADFLVVGIGASAGGLEACGKLLDALPAAHGMAFILIQHLDPDHESMMVGLLAGNTSMTVQQAAEGMPIEPDHLYIIPPGAYLSICNRALHLSPPKPRRGARLPFDFLLNSLAQEYGARAACVILSGTGADGSIGLQAIKRRCGLVIAQDPDEAGHDGMPRSAIMTGAVDLVLPLAEIPAALARCDRGSPPRVAREDAVEAEPEALLPRIVDLLRTRTAHDFTLYKPGTLSRRIERRMAMAGTGAGDAERYLGILEGDTRELDLLAKDLLINVTSFFRDPAVFDLLARRIVPDLVRGQASEPVRIWIAGCSTGEETYSLLMLLHEQITEAKCRVKLQVFASDVDPDAVTAAREGLYPHSIEADVSPARLARFFSKQERGYRVSSELRASVVFAVQDVLADPPFGRLDMVSCRNLLIYLGPEAQAKVVALFRFALREGGVLLLGSSETIGNGEGGFEVISKSHCLFRRTGGRPKSRPPAGDMAERPTRDAAPRRPAARADLCRRLVMENYAPACVLINQKHECLYSSGPVQRNLRVVPGQPSHDLLAMAPQGLRGRLGAAIRQAGQGNARVIAPGGRIRHDDQAVAFNLDVHPVPGEGETLLLVCFVDQPERERPPRGEPSGASHVAELERELEATRTDLQGAIHDLEVSGAEQKAINEEALSVNEEYQSTNEELLTSKEEMQSLNEELTALNSQLQETLEQQRTTSNDLQNVLYSTNVATLFLDSRLAIRFFTPATRSLFSVIPGDIGRPLADLNSLAADSALTADAQAVLHDLEPIEREVETPGGVWFVRRILPYRTRDDGVEGVVITFTDVTERKRVARALETAKQQAELASVAKSRFLAVASHDLRQPLQTLALLQGLLAKMVEGEAAEKLVGRLDQTLGAMSGMLNTLLDINQIEAGTVRVELADFPVDDLLCRLRDEFAYHAQAKELDLRVVPCGLSIRSDPRLLEQMMRNLLSNALKYTRRGKVLVGCRRQGNALRVEVWDTGVGIPEKEIEAIFEEYHQFDATPGRSRGLGLGLSIVRRLGDLLGHRVGVRSRRGRGSVFTIEVMLPLMGAVAKPARLERRIDDRGDDAARRTGVILVVEDDPAVCELLGLFLEDEGHQVATASDGAGALALVAGGIQPDLILVDYNLPGPDGLQVAAKLRRLRDVPVIVLTADISTKTLQDIAHQDCVQLNKPVKLKEFSAVIRRLLARSRTQPVARVPHPAEATAGPDTIFVVDDNGHVRETVRAVLEEDGRIVETYATCEAFLDAYRPGRGACLLIDAYLPGMSGLELLQRLHGAGHRLPAIMITGNSDVPMVVQAMKAGASDFIEKPIGADELLACIERALEQSRDSRKLSVWRDSAAGHVANLTSRQREIMELVLAGHPSKNIAADLGISQRTVENHRASIMKKTGSRSLPELARLALAAAWSPDEAAL